MNISRSFSYLLCGAITLTGSIGLAAAQNTPVTVENAQVIAYFSAPIKGNSELVSQAVAHGYYRILIKEDKNGYLIQDFYQDNNRKQTDPIYVTDPADLTKSGPETLLGKLKQYYPSGKLYSVAQFTDQYEFIHYKTYFENGNLQTKFDHFHDTSYQTYWYPNQKLALKIKLKDYEQVLSASGWKADGTRIAAEHCFKQKKVNIKDSTDQCLALLQKLDTEENARFDQMHQIK
ncbi:hypothetical protein EC844_109110 [Acinetobacter calcoaceticus]|uniref:Uncharacterized protein n=1 Tax=Acinetobacter calcoaceticus TaxID=471 RepID=A0A4V2R165_ACICA|nr:hypothetical protein EC844_109110 [Acinetobacter calcoaceticus]